MRSFHVWPPEAQNKKTDDRQYVKHNDSENQKSEQLSVGTGETQDTGPYALNPQRYGRCVAPVYIANAFEEQSVFGHRVINARSGQDQSVVAAKCGNHDGDGYEYRAAGPDDHFSDGRAHAITGGELDSAGQHGASIRSSNQRQHV